MMAGRYFHSVATLQQHCRIVPYHTDRQSEVVEFGSFGTDAGSLALLIMIRLERFYTENVLSRTSFSSLGAFDVYSAFHFSLAVRRMQLPKKNIMVRRLSSK